jgi:NADH-quinone oxidoreductase subunit J
MPTMLAATASMVDLGVFAVAAVVILAGALGVVFARNPVHSALMLVMTLFGVAVLFVEQNAQFLAAVQVIVYAGAIVVLFLFVIMLIGVDREENIDAEPLRGQRPAAIGIGLLLLFLIWLLGDSSAWTTGTPEAPRPDTAAKMENVEELGRVLYTTYLLAFEVTGVLLVIAVVGAVVLARKPPRMETPEELSDELLEGLEKA